jgi:DNA-binding beta-propeller fold protein YncE
MSRSSSTKPFRVMALSMALMLLLVLAAPASAAFLTFVQVVKDGEGGVDGLDGLQSATVSPDGAHVYAAGFNDDAAAVFSRDGVTEKLTFVEAHKDGVTGVDGLDEAQSVTVSPDGARIYTTGEYDDAVAALSRDANTGRITFVEVQRDGVSGIDGLDSAIRLAIGPDSRHV